jgi:hypothetical protein
MRKAQAIFKVSMLFEDSGFLQISNGKLKVFIPSCLYPKVILLHECSR